MHMHSAKSIPLADQKLTSADCQSAVAFQGEGIVALPGGTARRPQLVGGMAPVSQASVLAAGAGQAAKLPVLVHWVDDPVDAGSLHARDA